MFIERGERDNDNKTGLEEGRVIEMSTTVLPFAMLALFRLIILTVGDCNIEGVDAVPMRQRSVD